MSGGGGAAGARRGVSNPRRARAPNARRELTRGRGAPQGRPVTRAAFLTFDGSWRRHGRRPRGRKPTRQPPPASARPGQLPRGDSRRNPLARTRAHRLSRPQRQAARIDRGRRAHGRVVEAAARAKLRGRRASRAQYVSRRTSRAGKRARRRTYGRARPLADALAKCAANPRAGRGEGPPATRRGAWFAPCARARVGPAALILRPPSLPRRLRYHGEGASALEIDR